MLEKLSTEMKLRGFSKQTQKTYLRYNKLFLEFIKKTENTITQDDIKMYLAHLISDRENSNSSVALAKSALRYYYDEILEKYITGFKSPKKSKKLPITLTPEEIKKLIANAPTEKSRLMIILLYSSGIRVSELTKIKIKDIEPDINTGWVRQGKGGKDRSFVLSKRFMHQLAKYVNKHNRKANDYVFSGEKPLSTRDIQKIVKNTAQKAQISKNVTPHKLRHSFATHLLSNGTNIKMIQDLLGHDYLSTTEIYLSVSTAEKQKVISPYDRL